MIRVVAIAFLVACGSAPSCPIAPTPAGPAQPFLWKAQKADGPVVWLYGTNHNAGADRVPAAALAALDAAPKFLSELGDAEADPVKTAELIKLPPGKGLDQQLPASDWYDLRDALRGSMKEAELARVRPWFAIVRLNAKVAPMASPSMDVALARRARAKGKPVEALESLDFQFKALAETLTIADLQQEIHARHNLACLNGKLDATYAAGDLQGMTTILLIPATHSLVVDRSKAWLPKVEALFAGGGGFVAVGLGHLLGDEGIPAMLANAGYTVARVP